jgi:preprotein translocase subunit SecG
MILGIIVKVIHFIVCIGLIVVVLLQADKGEGLAGAFGGGSGGTVFGERGAGGIMTKITTGMAVIFMVTSLIISIWLPKWSENTGPTTGGYAPVQTSGSRAPIAEQTPAAPQAPVAPLPAPAPETPK